MSANKEHLRAWWQPVLDQMRLDDPEQEPPFWLATNNVVLRWSRLSEQIFRFDKWSPCRG